MEKGLTPKPSESVQLFLRPRNQKKTFIYQSSPAVRNTDYSGEFQSTGHIRVLQTALIYALYVKIKL